MGFYTLDPWDGARRFDLPAAIVASTVANVNRGKGSRALKPSDFMPEFGESSPQTAEGIFQQFKIAETMTTTNESGSEVSDPDIKVISPEEEA